MAIVILHSSICRLCGRVLRQGEEVTSFPAFAVSIADPHFDFPDDAFPTDCLTKANGGLGVVQRVEDWFANVGPGKRRCQVCGKEVTNPDDYILIDYLTNRESGPLSKYNYTHLHGSCVAQWQRLPEFTSLVRQAIAEAHWNSAYLSKLVVEILIARQGTAA